MIQSKKKQLNTDLEHLFLNIFGPFGKKLTLATTKEALALKVT